VFTFGLDIFVHRLMLLRARSSAAVALKAREVLISTQLPSYEERAVQMEQILKSSVLTSYYGEHGRAIGTFARIFSLHAWPILFACDRAPAAETLKELSDSRWGVYDVLPRSSAMRTNGSLSVAAIISHDCRLVLTFFSAALEVYARRAYRAYTLLSVDYETEMAWTMATLQHRNLAVQNRAVGLATVYASV